MRTHFRPFTHFARCVLLTTAITLPAGAEPGPGPIKIIDGIPPGFEVVRVTNEPVRSTVPEINDRSEVVWSTRVGEVYKIHRFANGIVETLTDGTTLDSSPTNNNESEIAWTHCPVPVLSSCNVAASFSPELIAGVFTPTGPVSMNTAGDVVWAYEIPGEPLRQEIVLFDRARGSAQIVTDVGLTNSSPRMNDQRQITWTRYNFGVSPWVSTIMFWSPGEITELTSGQTQAQGPDLNGLGQAVWQEHPGGGFTFWDGSIAANLFAGLGIVVAPRINDFGEMYFGLWNTLQLKWDAMLYKNQKLYRLPDSGLESEQGSLNNRSELAWRGGLDPGANSNILLLRRIAPKGDFNHDCRIDMVDLRVLQICFTGSDNGPSGGLLAQCARADFDEDGDVDAEDFCEFMDAESGPVVMVPGCQP